jgi:ATP-binding cassette subfamily F protein uup
LLLVSHDRQFIDNTVTSTLVFEGAGLVNEYVGGYQDWLRQRSTDEAVIEKTAAIKKPAHSAARRGPEQKELRALPGKIEKLEAKIETLHLKISSADYYQQDAAVISREQQQLQLFESELQQLYRRWEELESE